LAAAKRTSGKLTALAVSRAAKRGMYGDGHGLYLQVSANGSCSWIFRFKANGRVRHYGLGPTHTVTLADARIRAADVRRLILDGIDPIAARRERKAAVRLDAAKSMTFDQCAKGYITAHASGWKNKKHAAQWSATLKTYASPIFGGLPVAGIDTGLVLRALEAIWTRKPETASRLRGRIERVLDWARVRGYRSGENPARWKGHLDHLLPARSKVKVVEHHAALPYAEIGAFMADLRCRGAGAARALEFLILTATRTSETLNASWAEIDFDAKVWTIQAERMKGGREHRVPLSDASIAILEELPREGAFVFPGQGRGGPLSNMALIMQLRRMGRSDLTGHGFRSTFRDWCAEQTAFPAEVAEMALAHAIRSKVEAAYRRGDLFAKRRKLMDEWAAYCKAPASLSRADNIVAIRRGG
jgi:integrase